MALTFGLTSIRDLHAKLQRDAATLDEEVTSDSFFNFVVTGYSMIDWVKNDPSVSSAAKVPAIVESLYNDHWLKVCGDLATASKHFTLTKRTPITSSASSLSGFGVGRFGKGVYGVGEESIEVCLNDGTSFHCLDMVQGVLSSWQTFFSIHGI
ncbi:hypothetical protein BIU88_09770 [Chlorobaculum limnaeum]|uniref:Uncharacterized protein n=1 Tax=Chlorobaculum limnaeum TaxID=274537 RepID=A0A1D8D1W0_CHLLM|nr:hypothetical protein [Chlorobaculum limnaeum]AOS84391.1 hypothetical protein BIU88_09770 [Chlorobaculum limnaeum]